MKVPCTFHGGPLDGQTRQHEPWHKIEVLISDPLPADGPRDHVPFAIAYYEPAVVVDLHDPRVDYFYRGEE